MDGSRAFRQTLHDRWEEFKSRQQPIASRSLEPAGLSGQNVIVGALVAAPIIKVEVGPSSSRSSRSTSSKTSPSDTPGLRGDGGEMSPMDSRYWDDLRSPMAVQKLTQALLHSCTFADVATEDAGEDSAGLPFGYRQRGCPRRLSPVKEWLGATSPLSSAAADGSECPPLSPTFSPTCSGRNSLLGEDLLEGELLSPVQSLPTSPTGGRSPSGRSSDGLSPRLGLGAFGGTPPELSRIQSLESICSLCPPSPTGARSPRDARRVATM
jgi:hypothetical protein